MSYLDKLRALESPKGAATDPTEPTKPPFVGFVGSLSPHVPNIQAEEAPSYTAADLAEIDALLIRLAELEGWEAEELDRRLSERLRMAPVNVLGALQALRAAVGAARQGWTEKPVERAQIALCRLVN